MVIHDLYEYGLNTVFILHIYSTNIPINVSHDLLNIRSQIVKSRLINSFQLLHLIIIAGYVPSLVIRNITGKHTRIHNSCKINRSGYTIRQTKIRRGSHRISSSAIWLNQFWYSCCKIFVNSSFIWFFSLLATVFTTKIIYTRITVCGRIFQFCHV